MDTPLNLFGHLLYLLVTWLGFDPKLAVALLCPVGVASTYFGHAKYSFLFKGHMDHAIFPYIMT